MNETCVSRSTSRRGPGLLLSLAVAAMLTTSGCMCTTHTFGDGPRGAEVRLHRTWYAGWGFIRINGLDSHELVGPADNYRVSTCFRATDVILNIFVSPLGFFRQTTLVEK